MKRSIKLIIYYFAYQLLFMAIGQTAYMAYQFTQTGSLSMNQSIMPTPLLIIISLLSSLAMLWHLLHFGYASISQSECTKVKGKKLALYVVLALSCMVWMNFISEKANLPDIMEQTFLIWKDYPLGIVAIAIMAPILEELLFRGAIMRHLLAQGKRPQVAILISALIFGLVHINPAQVLFAFMFGILLGWVLYHSGSLFPCILIHFINNSISVILMYLYGADDQAIPFVLALGAMAITGAILLSFYKKIAI